MKIKPKEVQSVEIISNFFSGKIHKNHALGVLKVKDRQFRRLLVNYKDRGVFGLIHGNSGKVPWSKIPSTKEEEKIDCPSYPVLRRICHQ